MQLGVTPDTPEWERERERDPSMISEKKKKKKKRKRKELIQYLDFDELRGGNQPHARAALDPHLAVRIDAGAPRAAPASMEEGSEGVGVSVRVARPVLDAGVNHVELEREVVLEDVRARGGG